METEKVVISVRPDRRESAHVGYGLRATIRGVGDRVEGCLERTVRRKLYLAIVSTLNAASAVVPLRRHQESGAGSIPGLRGGGAYDARRIADGDKIPVVILPSLSLDRVVASTATRSGFTSSPGPVSSS
jgi:hypothetical protein